MSSLIKQHLQRAQLCMKHQEDKQRIEHDFAIGDRVYLKLQPYVQMVVARRSCQKLSFKYIGPYQVEAKIGEVAYCMKLPLGRTTRQNNFGELEGIASVSGYLGEGELVVTFTSTAASLGTT